MVWGEFSKEWVRKGELKVGVRIKPASNEREGLSLFRDGVVPGNAALG